MLDKLAVVIAALCSADSIMYDRFLARFEEALAEGERSVADFKPPRIAAMGLAAWRHRCTCAPPYGPRLDLGRCIATGAADMKCW